MTRADSAPAEAGPIQLGGFELLHPITTQGHAQVFLARAPGGGPAGGYRFLKVARAEDRPGNSNRLLELEFERLVRLENDLFISPRRFLQLDGRNAVEFPFEEGISLSEILGRLRERRPDTAASLIGDRAALAVQCCLLDAISSVTDHDGYTFLALSTAGADHVLVTRDRRLRLVGFADVLEKDAMRLSEVWSPFTAPELFVEGRSADRRADIFSAGVLLFQLLTGRSVISDGEPSPHLAYRLYRNLHPKVSDVAPALSELDPLVARALRWLPEERFQTPEEFKEAILALRREMRDPALPEFQELFRLGLDLRRRKTKSAGVGGDTVGVKLSSID